MGEAASAEVWEAKVVLLSLSLASFPCILISKLSVGLSSRSQGKLVVLRRVLRFPYAQVLVPRLGDRVGRIDTRDIIAMFNSGGWISARQMTKVNDIFHLSLPFPRPVLSLSSRARPELKVMEREWAS